MFPGENVGTINSISQDSQGFGQSVLPAAPLRFAVDLYPLRSPDNWRPFEMKYRIEAFARYRAPVPVPARVRIKGECTRGAAGCRKQQQRASWTSGQTCLHRLASRLQRAADR